MKKENIKKILFAVSAAGVSATVMYITTDIWVKTALNREQPKVMKKAGSLIAGGKADSKFKSEAEKTSRKLRAKKSEEIKIRSSDGIVLTGHLVECKNPERIIIAFHGWRSSWSRDFGLISEFWYRNNCSVLYAEQRGQNNSDGKYMGFGMTERFDCVAWVNWVTEHFPDVKSVYLAGVSMGASTVLMSADLDFGKKPCGIMADCGFTSPKDIWRHVARKNLHMLYGIRSIIADMICKRKINIGSGEISTLNTLKNTDIPVLFIHGTDDRFVPVKMSYENYKVCASPKYFLAVPGADHAMSYYKDKKRYEKAEKDFWHEFDKK